MRIAIDFDDTVADQTAILLSLMNWKLGTAIKFEELEWDFFHRNQITEDAFWQIHDLYDSTYLRRAMPPVAVCGWQTSRCAARWASPGC